MPARPYHIPCHVHQAIYTMPARSYHNSAMPDSHTINHAMPARPTIYHDMTSMSYYITCHAHQPYYKPCHVSQSYHIHAMPAQAIPYTKLCPRDHVIYHAIPARPYHIPWYAHQAIQYTICDAHHILCHASQDIPYTYYAMPGKAITYTMSGSPGHTIYLSMPARSYHIPCHATANDYLGQSCLLSKGANGLLTRCMIAINSLVRWFRFIVCLCGLTKFVWKQVRIILKVLAVITHRFQTGKTILAISLRWQ